MERWLSLAARLVPAPGRTRWRSEWIAELEHDRVRRDARGESRLRLLAATAVSCVVAARDAVSLRRSPLRGAAPLLALRVTVRTLAARPAWTAAAIGSLALGLGAATGVFSLVHGVLLRPLPFEAPDRLLVGTRELTYPMVEQLYERQSAFDPIGAFSPIMRVAVVSERPERVSGAVISAGALRALGVRPGLGRWTTAAADAAGAAGAVLLSHVMWVERFGADANVLGTSLILDDQPHTIVGVMPPEFRFPTGRARFWQSMAHVDRSPTRWYLSVIGRARALLSTARARAAIAAIELREAPGDSGPGDRVELRLRGLHDHMAGAARPLLLAFQAAVLALLLLTCLNVINLLLARAADRHREVALRSALGASAGRLVGLVLAETITLALAGGALGLGVAHALVRGVLAYAPAEIPLRERVAIDLPVLGAAMLTALGVGLVVAIVPAMRAIRVDPTDGLSEGSHQLTEGSRRRRLRQLLVASELGIALVLLAAGGLLAGSFLALARVDHGLDPEPVLLVRFPVPEAAYPSQVSKSDLYGTLLARLESLAAVERASAAASYPFTGSYSNGRIETEDRGPEDRIATEVQVVTDGYFATMGIPLRSGRDFVESDTRARPVAIVSDRFASLAFPGGPALGRRIRGAWGLEDTWITIVGVVGDIRHRGLAIDAAPQVYLPYTLARWPWDLAVAVRARGSANGLPAALQESVVSLDDSIPVPSVVSLREVLSSSVGRPRFLAVMSSAFATAALLIAVVGVYGVVAHAVSRRTREFGIRIALGATARQVTVEVVRETLATAAVGIGIGLIGTVLVARTLQRFLFALGPHDPIVLAASALALVAAATLASYTPARRAGRLDPTEALRSD